FTISAVIAVVAISLLVSHRRPKGPPYPTRFAWATKRRHTKKAPAPAGDRRLPKGFFLSKPTRALLRALSAAGAPRAVDPYPHWQPHLQLPGARSRHRSTASCRGRRSRPRRSVMQTAESRAAHRRFPE